MQHKGYLKADGKVTNNFAHPDVVGVIGYSEVAYNLRRYFVSRSWIVILGGSNMRFEGETRREAIAKAMAYVDATPGDDEDEHA